MALGLGKNEWLTQSNAVTEYQCHHQFCILTKNFLTLQTSLSPQSRSLAYVFDLSILLPDPPAHPTLSNTAPFQRELTRVCDRQRHSGPVLPNESSPWWAPQEEHRGRHKRRYGFYCLGFPMCWRVAVFFQVALSPGLLCHWVLKTIPSLILPNLQLFLISGFCMVFCSFLHPAHIFRNGLIIPFYSPFFDSNWVCHLLPMRTWLMDTYPCLSIILSTVLSF